MVNQTLILHQVFTGLAVIIMASRLICRQAVFRKFNFGDYCTMAAIFCAATRGGIIHVILTWGTNNISPQVRSKINFTPEEVYRRTIGSILTIANRPVYNSYLWLQKLVLLHFLIRNFHTRNQRNRYLWSYGLVFLATWLAAQIVGFTECDPFYLYWQVLPAPGRCVQAQVQLIVLGVLNIITDFMLLALPIPTLLSLKITWCTKIRLYALCALGLFIIAITIIRLPINHIHATVQANRTTWASSELLTAAIVVNAPVLYGAINHWRRQFENSNAIRAREDDLYSVPTPGISAKHRTSRRPTLSYHLYDDDDSETILRAPCQASVTSNTTHDDRDQVETPMETPRTFDGEKENLENSCVAFDPQHDDVRGSNFGLALGG